jgi:predicted nuclease of restriction endonuclease-like (RecB) superfamily
MPPIIPATSDLANLPAFVDWILELKKKIQIAKNKLVFSMNSQIMELYREIGKEVTEKQQIAKRGSGLIEQIALELKHEFPEIKSFSTRNLYAMAQWYKFYVAKYQFLPHGVAQIPWGHNRLIISKVKEMEEAEFYVFETAKNGRDRDALEVKIKEKLYQKLGNSANNFTATLPIEQSKLAAQTVKDPYNFDFLGLESDALELAVEDELTKHITKFLLEL